jgi:hypothetical protein
MADGSAPAGRRVAKYALALAWAAAAAAVVGGVWAPPWGAPKPANRRLARLVAESPFRNVEPGVGYVGDAACSRCHADVAESYRAHPMGRSVVTVAAATEAGPRAAPAAAEFDAGGYHYTVERREGRLIHREQRFDAGEPVASVEAAVAYALGSGERGYSFLVERDGFVAQSPVAWYAQERRYDLAPGYQSGAFISSGSYCPNAYPATPTARRRLGAPSIAMRRQWNSSRSGANGATAPAPCTSAGRA